MSTAQIIFSIALAVVALIIVLFSIYVLNTTLWGNRWVRKPQQVKSAPVEEDAS